MGAGPEVAFPLMGMVSPWKDPECSFYLSISLLFTDPHEITDRGLLSCPFEEEQKGTGHGRGHDLGILDPLYSLFTL